MKKYIFSAVLALLGAWIFAQERIAVFQFEDMDNILTKTETYFFYDEFCNELKRQSAGKFSVLERKEVEDLFGKE